MRGGEKMTIEVIQDTTHLRRIHVGLDLVIPPTGGTKTLAKSEDVFTVGISPNFHRLDVPSKPTEKTPVAMYELVWNNGTYSDILSSLGKLEALCLEQSQISEFCREYNYVFKTKEPRGGTIFLFKVRGELFVADVRSFPELQTRGGLTPIKVEFDHFWIEHVFYAAYRHRFVVPIRQ